MKTSLVLIVAIVGAIWGLEGTVHAQAAGFASNRFEPSERGSEWFVNESLDFRGAFRPAAGAVFDWAYKPLLLFPRDNLQGERRAQVITDQIFIHTGASVVLADRFLLGVNVPVAIYQHGDELEGISIAARSPSKPALGDARLTADTQIFGAYGTILRGAVGAQLFLPTGSRAQFTGDGTVRVAPRFLFAGDVGALIYAAKIGVMFRPFSGVFEERPLGSELLFSAAVGLKANDRFVFGPELYGSTALSGDPPFRTRNTPLELLFGAHLTIGDDFQVSSGIGPGLTRGDGSPSMRVVFSVELTPDVCVDKDGDGICVAEDACPNVDGVHTTDPKTNGCPPPVAPATPTPPPEKAHD